MNIIKFNQKLFKKHKDFNLNFLTSMLSTDNLEDGHDYVNEHGFFTLADIDPSDPYRFIKRMNYDWRKKVIVFLDFRVTPYFEYEIKIDDLFDLDPTLETLSNHNSLQLDILDKVVLL